MDNRNMLLKTIGEVSFTLNDLTLYLDTHPQDPNAINQFDAMMKQRKDLLAQYANEFEPLTMDCVCTATNNQSKTHTRYPGQSHFTWSDGPVPWDNCAYTNGGI